MEFANGSGKVDPAANNPDLAGANDFGARYQKFALRMAIFPGDPRNNNPQIYFEKLPPELPAEFPLPVDTKLLGSLVRSAQQIDLYLDSSLTPEAIIEFYTQRLTNTGWQKIDPLNTPGPGQWGGFIPGNRWLNNTLFCMGSRGPSLTLQTNPDPDHSGDVRIIVNLDTTNNPCDQARQQRSNARPMLSLIPTLKPPSGNSQNFEGGGSGGNSNSWYSSASLESDLGLAELAVYYNAQLEGAGWQLSGQGVNGPVGWSQWALKDNEGADWEGRFLIYQSFTNARSYFLQANVSRNQPSSNTFQQTSVPLRF